MVRYRLVAGVSWGLLKYLISKYNPATGNFVVQQQISNSKTGVINSGAGWGKKIERIYGYK